MWTPSPIRREITIVTITITATITSTTAARVEPASLSPGSRNMEVNVSGCSVVVNSSLIDTSGVTVTVIVEVVGVMTTVLVGLGQGGWVGNDPGQSDVTETIKLKINVAESSY